MSVRSPRDVERLLELCECQADELGELRREPRRQTSLLERMLEMLASLARLRDC